MEFVVCLVLMNFLSFIKGQSDPPPLKADDINRIVIGGSSIITDSRWNQHTLKLLEGGKLGENNNVIAWKGEYDGKIVAVKIVWDGESYNDEVQIYEALGSMNNSKIEDEGIPRVYFHGMVLSKYFAIAMTLFDGTLLDRYEMQNEYLSDLTILVIFRRLIEILKYLHSKRVVHNDIKPENLFLRGSDVFVGDFDVATLNDKQNDYGTALFASKNFWHGQNRTAMDDLESLLYTMWCVAGVPLGGELGNYPEGRAHLDHYRHFTEEEWIMEKLQHIADDDVRLAFKLVQEEIISWGDIPYYHQLLPEFDKAINNVRMKPNQIAFEWLENGKTTPNDILKTTQKRLQETSHILATRMASPRVNEQNDFSGLLSVLPDDRREMGKSPIFSRFAAASTSTTPDMPKCFDRKRLKGKVTAKIAKKKLDFQLMTSRFKKRND